MGFEKILEAILRLALKLFLPLAAQRKNQRCYDEQYREAYCKPKHVHEPVEAEGNLLLPLYEGSKDQADHDEQAKKLGIVFNIRCIHLK